MNLESWIRKNQNYILAGMSSVGLVATVASALKSYNKAETKIMQKSLYQEEDISTYERSKIQFECFLPTIILGGGTVACIFGMAVSSQKKQMSLQSAYAVLDQTYKRFREHTEMKYGPDGLSDIDRSVAEENYMGPIRRPLDEIQEDESIFFDTYSGLSFSATLANVYKSMYEINRKIGIVGCASLNDFYKLLELEPIPGGDEVGWSDSMLTDVYKRQWVDFTVDKGLIENDERQLVDCYMLSTRMQPDECYKRF